MSSDRPRRVYIVQRAAFKNRRTGEWEDKYDLSTAEEYGRLVYLLPPGNIGKDMTTTMARLEHRLSEYEPGDHLLAVGDPVAIAAAVLVAGKWNDGEISLLKWDRIAQVYYPYKVSVRE